MRNGVSLNRCTRFATYLGNSSFDSLLPEVYIYNMSVMENVVGNDAPEERILQSKQNKRAMES